MQLSNLLETLNTLSPFEFQEEWDNCGLQIGNPNDDVKNIYLSLDIDFEMLESLPCDTTLITHHPLIFRPLKNLDFSRYPQMLIKKMADKNISLISLHTNFDKTHLNSFVAKKIFNIDESTQDEYIFSFSVNMSFDDALEQTTKALKLSNPRYVKSKEQINRCSIITGSGASFIPKIKSDLFLTGDIKYHDALMAKNIGLSLIDIGHYESEIHFCECLRNELELLGIAAIIADFKNPYQQ